MLRVTKLPRQQRSLYNRSVVRDRCGAVEKEQMCGKK